MVNFTGESTDNISNNNIYKFFILADDVNESNFKKYNSIYNLSRLIIEYKFPMPLNGDIVITNHSKTITSVNNILYNIEKDVRNNKSKIFTSDTQFKNFKTKVLFWVTGMFNDIIKELDSDNSDKDIIVTVRSNISKHEWELIKILNINAGKAQRSQTIIDCHGNTALGWPDGTVKVFFMTASTGISATMDVEDDW